ncbi:MAG: type II toxin-antitoxin system Phd/YefM family antitoxin [Acidimicrobiia bacterium]
MARTVTVSDARATLPEILERVTAGEEVTLTRHGVPVAVVVRPDRLRIRRAEEAIAAAERLSDLIEESGRRPLAPPTLSLERAEELLAALRADRESR